MLRPRRDGISSHPQPARQRPSRARARPPGAPRRRAAATDVVPDEMGTTFRLHPERVCITGTGTGAAGAWLAVAAAPDRFASIAASSGRAVTDPGIGPKLKHTAVMVVASNDPPTRDA